MCSRLGYATRGNLFYPTLRLGLLKLFSKEVIFPSERIYTVRQGSNEIKESRWGVSPDQIRSDNKATNKKKPLIINSRKESIRKVWNEQMEAFRCIVLATHYYEYRAEMERGKNIKQPYRFSVESLPELALAGFFAENNNGETSATIITVPASSQTESYHDRMPAILAPDQIEQWLSPSEKPQVLIELLNSYNSQLDIQPTSRALLAVPRNSTSAPEVASAQDDLFNE